MLAPACAASRRRCSPASTVTVRSAQACSITRFWRRSGKNHVRLARRIAPVELRSAAARDHRQAGFIGAPQNRGRLHCSSAGSTTTASRQFCHNQNRSATPAISSGCGTYSPGFSPHSRVRGKHFGGIRKQQRIERAAHALHRIQVRLGEHFRHHVFLLFAHAVLAGDRSALLDAQFQNPLRQPLGRFFLTGDAAIVHHQRMQIAIARMKNVGHAQPGRDAQLVDLAQNLRQRSARDHAVLHDVVGRDPAHRRERRLAAFPNQRALGFGLRHADLPRAVLRQISSTCAISASTSATGPSNSTSKQPAAVGIVGVHRRFGGLDRQVVHHLNGRRKHPGRDDPADRRARLRWC